MKNLCLVFALCLSAFAQKFTIDQVMSAPFPNQLITSKSAPRVAWVFNDHGASNIWVADAPDWKGRQLTNYKGDDGMPLAAVAITPDGKTILFARGSETNGEGLIANPTTMVKQPKQQVWAVDVEKSGAEPRLLGDMNCGFEGCEDIEISPDGKWAVWYAKKKLSIAPVDGSKPARDLPPARGDNSSAQWSPDGKHIAFVSDRGDHSFIAVYDLDPERVRYVAPTVDRDEMPRWSPEGDRLMFVRHNGAEQRVPQIPLHPDPWSILVSEDAATAERPSAREVWHSTKNLAGSLPWQIEECLHFMRDGVIVFNSEEDGRSHLYSIAAGNKGTQTAKLLTPGNFDVESTSVSPDDTEVLYQSNQWTTDRNDEDRRHIWRVKASGGKPVAVTKGETIEWSPVESKDGTVFCIGSSATTPDTAYRVTANGRENLAPQALPQDFPTAELVVPKQVIFKSADGKTIHGQLFVPKGQTGAAPAIIHTHGGPPRQMMLGFHYSYYYSNAYSANQYLANLGYVVLSVNYRLGIMYGRDFRRVPNGGARGGAEYQDLLAGAKYLQTLPIVDAKKIGLWGGSYGGYMTAMGLARNSDIFKAGVDFHGVHDWSAIRTYRWDTSLAAPDAKAAADLAFKSSPDSSLAGWKSPVLFIHGDDDRNVPFTETTNLIQHLRKQNVDFEELIFPDEIHDLLLWKDWVESYRAMGDFFQRKLK